MSNFLTMILKVSYTIKGELVMFGRRFSIFRLLGWVAVSAVVLLLVFKASITGSIV